MDVQITNEELATFNVINGHVAQVEAELRASIAARDDYLAKLEEKYNARYDLKAGKLISRDGKGAKEQINRAIKSAEEKKK